MDYCNHITPETPETPHEKTRKIMDNSELDLKRFNNIFSFNTNKRYMERKEKREKKQETIKRSFKNNGRQIKKEIN